jgi:hypothetical protein
LNGRVKASLNIVRLHLEFLFSLRPYACPEPFGPELTAEGRSRGGAYVPYACLDTVALRVGWVPFFITNHEPRTPRHDSAES